MKRRNFIELLTATGGAVATASLVAIPEIALAEVQKAVAPNGDEKLTADIVIVGGGLGGVAAAMAALRNSQTVVLTEETDWIGGQLTSQGVPPDEHRWIETHGATQLYRDFRNGIRDYYRRNYPLTEQAKQNPLLNPGDGAVSRLCHEPRVALAVLQDMLAPYISSGKLVLLLRHKVSDAQVSGNKVGSVTVRDLQSGKHKTLLAPYFVDATELGDLLPLTGTEFVTGTESKKETRELHAPDKANPDSNQAFTMCFAMDYVPGANHVIDKPEDYDFWVNHVPELNPAWAGKLLALHYSDPRTLKPKNLGFHPEGHKTGDMLNLWNYRKIINKENFKEGVYAGDITIVNWPQNDYMLGNLIGASEKEFDKHVRSAKQLSLSLLYWLQTEAPRPDGGKGWPGLRLRKDIMGTEDGLAKYPYVREARRIKAVFTVLEEHVGKENRAKVAKRTEREKAASFYDSVGTGYYHIDLHPTSDKVNYVDFASLPFQIPLGALLPVRMENLLPANKNIGTTHITNGCFRLHPVEWNIGESVGMLVKFARSKSVIPRKVREDKALLAEFQDFIRSQGIATEWPKNTSSDEA
ncbi:FAD-dependent oxidoreductase [Pontibacter korlensis]|uniref:FAD-dependent oxidoreductase n=1 Tax=Pontibacter korlensis TaxID=400092 RepID=A0A0E3UYR3_9BACT|nr:FAD-dependent oxidoreductase [Pontibacter korlensis]AKD05372.1 FAD-dependent oxidoreductase [Pontibacter korlensis]